MNRLSLVTVLLFCIYMSLCSSIVVADEAVATTVAQPVEDLLGDPSAPAKPTPPAPENPKPQKSKDDVGVKDDAAQVTREEAIQLGIAWLRGHQLSDGGWNFDHRPGRCKGRCDHPGSMDSARHGATALALMAMMGPDDFKKGKIRTKSIRAGLIYLASHMKENGSLCEPGGTMYSHGMSTAVLCDAYGYTQSKALLKPAQLALKFISDSQDPVGGGWRYQPRQPGDTSVFGWQWLAMQRGKAAKLKMDPKTFREAGKFLDSVQAADGAFYGYTTPRIGGATSAIGLLARMESGWKRDNPALTTGIQHLAKRGISNGNLYSNYYVTRALRAYGGELWKSWDEEIAKSLLASQDRTGHANGSWFLKGGGFGAERGGRLYSTALAVIILRIQDRYESVYSDVETE